MEGVDREDAQAEGHRHERLQQLIFEELAGLFRDEVTDPRLDDVRCTGVELSVDYRSARVRFVLPEGADLKKAERAFERAAAFLQTRLADALDLKRVPALRLVYDHDAAAAKRAAEILDKGS